MLDLPSEMIAIESVNATIHESEAIGRADDSIDGQVEDRPAVYRHVGQIATVEFPSIGKLVLYSGEYNPHDATPQAAWISTFPFLETGKGSICLSLLLSPATQRLMAEGGWSCSDHPFHESTSRWCSREEL